MLNENEGCEVYVRILVKAGCVEDMERCGFDGRYEDTYEIESKSDMNGYE